MKEVHQTEGEYIAYECDEKHIWFGEDEDLGINLASRQADEDVTVDVCQDQDGNLVMGFPWDTWRYVAQVLIPAKTYTETTEDNPDYDESVPGSQKTTAKRTANPFDIDDCTIYLYAL